MAYITSSKIFPFFYDFQLFIEINYLFISISYFFSEARCTFGLNKVALLFLPIAKYIIYHHIPGESEKNAGRLKGCWSLNI